MRPRVRMSRTRSCRGRNSRAGSHRHPISGGAYPRPGAGSPSAHNIEGALESAGAPPAVLGIIVAMLVLTFVVASISLVAGRTSVLLGAVHLVIFAAFLFLALVP